MRTKPILLAATLVIPLLAIGCNRQEQSPTAKGPSVEKQAMAPSSQEKMPESTPPAAGTPPSATGGQSTPSTPPAGDSSSAPQNEPKKGSNY